ncbi:hypothetical protein [Teredinibacter purpureus]|uniref:hypothetical protein n=1 Tax=Teredinibacter purpureus TaxID=2731756 RepID=UPI0005F799CE|nr:hypothetical protein [Teredinibacter purpureus]
MTIDNIESISVIAASWVGIICGISALFNKGASNPEERKDRGNNTSNKYTLLVLLKFIRVYILSIIAFILVVSKIVISTKSVSIVDVVATSSCIGAIVFMLVVCVYKYTLWKTMRNMGDY